MQIAKNFQKFLKLKALTALINDSNCKNEVFQKMNDIVFIGKGKKHILVLDHKFVAVIIPKLIY